MSRGRSETRRCAQCDKAVRIPPNRFESFKFCSRSCLWHYHNDNQGVTVSCKECGSEFRVIDFRAKTARYCSRPCYYKAMKRVGLVVMTCAHCRKSFRRPPSRAKGRPCCSVECRGLLHRKTQPAAATSARDWMERRGALSRCERCAYDEHPEILVVHHRDRNRGHNDVSNLEVLCPNCHALEHYGDRTSSVTSADAPR